MNFNVTAKGNHETVLKHTASVPMTFFPQKVASSTFAVLNICFYHCTNPDISRFAAFVLCVYMLCSSVSAHVTGGLEGLRWTLGVLLITLYPTN